MRKKIIQYIRMGTFKISPVRDGSAKASKLEAMLEAMLELRKE